MKIFHKWIKRPYGIMIVSGPTGSGKSTTLHAALKEIKNIENNIVTVEDPVEYRLDGITQIEAKEKIGLTFGKALRSVLLFEVLLQSDDVPRFVVVPQCNAVGSQNYPRPHC